MTDQVAPNTDTATFKRLIREHVKPYRYKLSLAVLCMILVAATTALSAWILKPALDDIFFDKNMEMLKYIPPLMIMIYFGKGMCVYFQNLIMKKLGQRIVTDIQIRLYDHLMHSDLSLIQKNSSGRIISRFTNDINIMRGAVSNLLTGIAKELLTVVALVGLMFYLNPTLSFIALIVFPLAVYPIIKLGRRMRTISHETQDEMGKYTARLDESFQSFRVIKIYQQEKYEISRATEIAERIYKLYAKAARAENLSSPIMETLGGVAIAGVIWYGGQQIIAGVTTPGTFFAFIAAFISAYKPLKSLSDLNNNLQEGLAAANRVYSILDIKPEIVEDKSLPAFNSKEAEIEFKNVSFHYPRSKAALEHLNLIIPAGKTVAFVGPSGGGKSTITSLIPRFYDPIEGEILLNGKNLKDYRLSSLRDIMALVTQDVMLFDDTIAKNIAFGKKGTISKQEIINAAEAAAAHDFINKLPENYLTLIGQHGFKLSGGQRQRISVARAILKNSPILILDEATSALDAISEKHIQKSLAELRKGKTTIIVAHRLTTIENADLIYVIDDGKVIESGTHKELLRQNNLYANLYKRNQQ